MGKKRIRNSVKSILFCNRIIFLVSVIISLVFAGIIAFSAVIADDNYNSVLGYLESGPQFIAFALSLVLGIMITCIVFKDTYSQQRADMELSAPTNAGQRFVAKMLAIFYMHILPLMVAVFAGSGVACIVLHSSFDTAGFTSMMKNFFIMSFYVVSADLFMVAILVIFLSAMGKCGESIALSCMVMAALSIIPYLFLPLLSCFSYGNNYTILNYHNIYWTFSSALFGIYAHEILQYIISIIISLICIALAFLIYRKRDGRNVGKEISNRLVVNIGIAIIIGAVFLSFISINSFKLAFIVSAIFFIVLSLIINRKHIKLRAVPKCIGLYVTTIAVVSVTVVLAYITDGFGLSGKPLIDRSVAADWGISECSYISGGMGAEVKASYSSGTNMSYAEKKEAMKKSFDIIAEKYQSRKHSYKDMRSLIAPHSVFNITNNYSNLYDNEKSGDYYGIELYFDYNNDENGNEDMCFYINKKDNWLTTEGIEQIKKVGKFYKRQ